MVYGVRSRTRHADAGLTQPCMLKRINSSRGRPVGLLLTESYLGSCAMHIENSMVPLSTHRIFDFSVFGLYSSSCLA